MSTKCTCGDGRSTVTDGDCTECHKFCADSTYNCVPYQKTFLGISVTVLLTFVVLSVVILVLMIWFSILVMKKCKGRPGWLNPVIITLLVLWLLIGWFPGLGFVFFIVLLVILIVFYNKCKRK